MPSCSPEYYKTEVSFRLTVKAFLQKLLKPDVRECLPCFRMFLVYLTKVVLSTASQIPANVNKGPEQFGKETTQLYVLF